MTPSRGPNPVRSVRIEQVQQPGLIPAIGHLTGKGPPPGLEPPCPPCKLPATTGVTMTKLTTPLRILVLIVALPLLGACTPMVVGAAGAVVADEIAEQEGGNLF